MLRNWETEPEKDLRTVISETIFLAVVTSRKQHLSIALEIGDRAVACVAGVNGKGEGERERGRKMGFWELGTRERLLFCMTDARRNLIKRLKIKVP